MKEINSNTNKNYKLCIQLASKKYRDKYGLYLIEGDNQVAEAIDTGVEIKSVFFREDYKAHPGFRHPDSYVLNKKLFDAAAQTENAQGVFAVVKKPEYSAQDFFKICGQGNIIVLDRLQDPGNVGTIIRTAEAAGYKGAILLKGTADIFSPKVVRAAAGSLFRLPVLMQDTPGEAIAVMKAAMKKITCASPESKICYYDIELIENIALIIGNEGNGICDELIVCADIKIRIPMEPLADSLNASVAAGILMFENKRKGRKVCTAG